jgi:perosamine synthetase
VNAKQTDKIISFIKDLFSNQEFIPLHEPRFIGNEKQYLSNCIDSTFVSSVGEYVGRFEKMISDFTGIKYAVATTNGTSALHVSLLMANVQMNDEVITQAITFIATANAISYCKATPIFIDSERESMGMCPNKLEEFLAQNAEVRNDGRCYNKHTGRRISACVPMHVFGHPVQIEAIAKICDRYRILLIEDAAESIGSYSADQKHTGSRGLMAVLSFNGNKIITCGGGGMLLTNDENIAKKAKHITTTAKVPHAWDFVHDEVGYNYRLPNINAALACAQMEKLPSFLLNKRALAKIYQDYFSSMGITFVNEPKGTTSNYWLNAIMLSSETEKLDFLERTNKSGVMTRPFWTPMNRLKMFSSSQSTNLDVANDLANRLVNIPSSVRLK